MSSQENNEGKIVLDRAKLAETIIDGATKTKSLYSEAQIFRVPEDLRELSKSAYTPQLIAIGPLHHDKEQLRKMKDVKIFYTYHLLAQLAKGVEDKAQKIREKLEECAEKMEKCVHDARKYYAEDVKVDGAMVEMMLFDGCFILKLLYVAYHDKKAKEAGKSTTKGGDSGDSKASSSSVPQPNNKGEDRSSGGGEQRKDPIFSNTLTANIVKHDLLLLENQIPFFVLEELFKLTVDEISGGTKLSLTEYVVSYFEDVMFPPGVKNGDCVLPISSSRNEIEQGEEMSWEANGYIHILHLLHSRCLPVQHHVPGQMENKKHSGIKLSELRISASDLDYAGVKLVGDENRSLFDITFEGGNFELPVIRVHGSTEAILRNLIAFEQCCPWVSQHYFTSYAMFMDMLIDSEKDIQVLKKAKVIQNSLGTDKGVFDLFNNLCKEVAADLEDFHFIEECRQAFKFTERNWWPMFIAFLKRTYFASPWGFIGFCLAFVAFGMSVLQFGMSVVLFIYNFFE